MLTVHHLRNSQSERIVWLCEELGIDYHLKLYDRRADNRMAPDDYKALHPMGIAPVITDGDFVLGESGAICDYINYRFCAGKLAPAPDHPDFAQHLFWLHFANGTFMTNGMMGLILAISDITEGVGAALVADRTGKAWALVEEQLGKTEFFGGSALTTADIMMGYGLTTGRAFRGTSIDGMPNLQAYLQRIGQRPAYRRMMEKAEPGVEPMLT